PDKFRSVASPFNFLQNKMCPGEKFSVPGNIPFTCKVTDDEKIETDGTYHSVVRSLFGFANCAGRNESFL
ncbi:MAG TPA: hypothetical protein PKM25_15930, partial [Candidatus Ozemobacteraceae bacterium]|nr:hypothetical protein [Candidatus Ozemobacteraceae bacterium]